MNCKEVGCHGCNTGHWIEEFISCGPKNYTYRLNTGETSCKVRGFSLNYKNSQAVNFLSVKNVL